MNGLKREFDIIEQLHKDDGWYVHDMKEFGPKMFEVFDWCCDTIGPMLTVYDADIRDCRWHGARVDTYGAGVLFLFAFKNEADYTMLKLKFA